MLNIRGCGFCFVIAAIFIYLNPAFAKEDLSLDLEPIVISKSKVHLINPYSLESDYLENSPFSSWSGRLAFSPLDLQSRALRADIQTDFSLRGSTYQGVLVLIDGQRVNDPKLGHYNCDLPITAADIQRVEVIPGAGSSLFGPDAIGGAINIILNEPKDKTRVLEASCGSYQTKSVMFSITERKDNLGVRLSAETQESEGFYYDTDFKRFVTTLKSSLDIPDGKFNLDLGYLEKEFGAYDFYTPASGYASKEWINASLLSLGLNLQKQDFIIKPNFLWQRHHDKFMLDKTQQLSTSLNHHRSDVFTPNIYFQKESEILGRIGLGLEYGNERVSSTVLGKHNREHKSIFMDNSKELTPGLSSGLSYRIDDYDSFGQAHTASFSLRGKVSKANELHLGVSRSIRIPSFHELYYSDPTTVGNIGLCEEKSMNYEAGLDYSNQDISAGLTFFLRQEEDSIDWIKRTTAQSQWKAENITEADIFGVENYLRFPLRPNLDFDSNYTYIDKRIDGRSYLYKYGQNYIRHAVNAVFSFNLPFGTQVIGFSYKKKPARDGWLLMNARFSYNLNKNSQIFLKITNLLNVEYQEIAGIPQPGRWIEAGLRFEW